MSRWAHEHPEEMAEIAALPPSQQNDAMRAAVGYDPDYLRELVEQERWAEAMLYRDRKDDDRA